MSAFDIAEKTHAAVERLTKWRRVFAARILGCHTLTISNKQEDQAPVLVGMRDQFELSMLLRVDCNALARLLIEKKVFTAEEWTQAIGEEADALSVAYSKRFPGFKAVAEGMDINLALARDTMKGWPFCESWGAAP